MPATFGRYELLKRLAGGGMGEVYLARQRGLAGFSKLIVIKTLLPHLCEDEEFITMFKDEARLTAQLIHPNICQTFEFDQIDATWYIAMEYLRGEDVRRLWKASASKGLQVPVPLLCRIIADAAAGLDFAHELRDSRGEPYGIVHRDISPQNILVTFEGGVKIIDFGVAKAQGRLTHTRTGALKGKYGYMSPEQVNGEQVDHRTDIFALGIVLHELLTSVRLFKSDSDVSTIERVKKAPIPPPSQLNPSLPPGIDALVMKALERDIGKRYQTARQFRLALENWLVQERMSASSAHLAQFLEEVYQERLAQEARHGPMLGEASPQSIPIGAHRPPTGELARAATPAGKRESFPFPFEPEPAAAAPAAKEAPPAERTPSQPSRQTNPGPVDEPSKKSVIDLSMIQTESGAGPFQGKKGLRFGVAVAAALAIVLIGAWSMLGPPAPPPAKVQALPESHAQITVDPPQAALAIDGTPTGKSSWEGQGLRPGSSLRVDASLEGYAPQSHTVTLQAGANVFAVRLERSQISLLVKSDPEDAEVTDGARILGRTPFNWSAPKGVQHTLTFRHAGYRDLVHQVNATGAEAELTVRLRRLEERHQEPRTPPRHEPAPPDQAIKLER